MLDISGAIAVITGGASGIGESLAKYWVRQGGKVVLADIEKEGLSRVEKEIRELGGEVVTTICDVTKEEDNHASTDHTSRSAGADSGGVHRAVGPSDPRR